MKYISLFGIAVSTLLLGVTGASAQINHNYDCATRSEVFSAVQSGTLISPNDFLDFAGTSDLDDGVATNIPIGFNFDFNGNNYQTVNVCVNGWVSVGHQSSIATITGNNNGLFLPTSPNNVLAPFWGNHYLRTLQDAPQGFKQSRIQVIITKRPDPNVGADPGSFLHTATIEWSNLNINDKSDTNSTATFQVSIVENPLANDKLNPDRRATIEFHYGNSGSAKAAGATIGICDSLGFSYMNGLFSSSVDNGDSTRLSTTATTSCWPPPNCTPNTVIVFTPHSASSAVSTENSDIAPKIVCSNYPNPFTKSTKINFWLPEEETVRLTVYDAFGREVATLLNSRQSAGNGEVFFDASQLSSGVYEYRLQTPTTTEIRSMTLIK